MQTRICGNEYRTTVVCIDSYDGKVPSGRFYNPSFRGGQRFQSLVQFLLKMEDNLDGLRLPQSFTAARAFAPPPASRGKAPPDPGPQEGKLATFAVRVLFRQNASWQGSVTWLERGREESFRSVLELTLLMDSALSESSLKKQVPASSSNLG